METDETDTKVSFRGERLGDWMETQGKHRSAGEDGKPRGVRWSVFCLSLDGFYISS